MALSIPHASAEAHALSARYFDRASPSNRLAAPAPSTRPLPRVAPRAELAAALETAATLGGSAAVVLAALLSWADANGTAWPCVASIARRSGKSERTVYDALDRLEEAGVIVRHRPSLGARRRSRQSNTYVLAIPPHALPPSSSRAESPCPPRRAAPARPRRARPAPPSSCSTVAPVVVVDALVPAEASPSSERDQLKILQTKGPGDPDRQNARADAQARAATAPPSDRLGPPAVAQSVPEVTPTKITSAEPSPPEALPSPRLTRAERSARNRAAWSKRTRPSASATRAPAPRRAPAYRAPVERVPDPRDALAELAKWRSTLPALGRETDRESATPAPVPGVRRPDLAQRAPVALQGLLEAFARVHVEQHAGPYARPTSARADADSPTRSDPRGATAPSSPRVEARPPSLRSTDSRRS